MGGASPHPRSVSSSRASSADSTVAILTCVWRAGCYARALSRHLWRGSNPAIFPHSLARRCLWTPRHPPLVRYAGEVVDSADVCICRRDGGRNLLWDLEGQGPTQNRL